MITGAQIIDEICVNIAVFEDEPAMEKFGFIPLPEGYGIGDKYINGEWVSVPKPEPPPIPAREPTPDERLHAAEKAILELAGEIYG